MQLTQAHRDMILTHRLMSLLIKIRLVSEITEEMMQLHDSTAPIRYFADIGGIDD